MQFINWIRNHQLKLEVAAVVIAFILMITGSLTSILTISPIFWGLAFIIGGFSKAVEGVTKTIEEKSLNVEFLMIAAASAAFFTGEYAEGAVLIFIFAVSGVLEAFAMAQSEKALTQLLKAAPKTALKLVNGKEVLVEISALAIQDVVVVKPGQQVPADGMIVRGGASVDQSSITGEFNPVNKLERDSVFAGSIVLNSTIQVVVQKDPNQSLVQKMITLVENAQAEKTKSEKRVSTFEKIYVYFVIALALFVIFLTPVFGWLDTAEAFRRGVIVLVVASPCALVASITPALLSTLSHSARKGILIKSGKYIELLRQIDVVTFDKTGTLTTGKPKVTGVYFSSPEIEKKTLPVLITAEKQSNHPLAKAIAKHFDNIQTLNLQIKEMPGRGLEVTYEGKLYQIGNFPFEVPPSLNDRYQNVQKLGQTTVGMIQDGKLVGFITLQDTVRPEAKLAIDDLKALQVEPVMLTGDKKSTASAIANLMGIQQVFAESLPTDKVNVVKNYILQNKKVLMIGDGINDAPALATATIGVSMGDGTDVSLETADIVMVRNQLQHIPYLIRLAKRTQGIILQNVIFSISVILILLISNLFGIVILRYGVLGHELSTILVILNSLRLLPIKQRK
jgi:Cd2+/Zn2+-exporting ATPase